MPEVIDKSVEELRQCLDNWSTKTSKNKRKKKKDKEKNLDTESEVFTAEVEPMGKTIIILVWKF